MADKKKGFDLAAALGSVSNLDTGAAGREQIEYIDLDRLDADTNNFYEISGVDELASNILLLGLQQPIRVRAVEGDRFVIVSGHRRRAALQQLVEEGHTDFKTVPCIRERSEGSAALQELRLIFANSDTRRMTSAEISKQTERVEMLLYQLKEEGYEFPGRMRDYVAEACKISRTKLANLKVIRENLDQKTWKAAWEKGEVVDSVALTIAKLPRQDQLRCWQAAKKKTKLSWYYESDAKKDGDALKAISEVPCPDGGTCRHIDQKFLCHRESPWNGCSGRCCGKCPELGSCDYACDKFYEQIKQIRADKREERKQQRLAQAEKDRPDVEQITALWARFAEARMAAGLTIDAYTKAAGIYTDERTKKNWPEREAGRKITRDTGMPYSSGNGFALWDIRRLLRVAEILGVSIDYLLCRTDDPQGMGTKAPVEGWVPLEYLPGKEPAQEGQDAVAKFQVSGSEGLMKTIVRWCGGRWCFPHGAAIDAECVGWFPLPKEVYNDAID